MTTNEKIADFQYLAGLYAKRYGPYEWKRDVVGFDLMNTAPWIARIAASKSDLEFYDLMSEYVASLNDAHDGYSLPSNFTANLNFSVDLYDGVPLVDSINRARLPAPEFPFMLGYELVSIDGEPAAQLLGRMMRYDIAANDRSTRRFAAALLTLRPQSIMPFAASVPEISTVVFRRPDGKLESYRIPWTRSGLPLTSVGRIPDQSLVSGGVDDADPPPDYMEPLLRLQNCLLPDRGVLNFGSRTPIFVSALGAGFTQRLGLAPADAFFSGVFDTGRNKFGYIRIPSFSPSDQTSAINAFLKEVTFFQTATDGLIVDIMRNPGGSVGYTNTLVSLLMPDRWSSVGFELRATSEWVVSISSSLESAKAQGASPLIIAQLEAIRDAIVSANAENRGRTGPVPLDALTIDRDPLTAPDGSTPAYKKPVLILVDELSASAADYFAATLQDNNRAILFGMRTMGAGGNVTSRSAGSYSLGSATVTESLMSRNRDVVTPDFPVTRYIENVGVRPDIEYDYMTRANYARNGGAFIEAFLSAMSDYVRKGQ